MGVTPLLIKAFREMMKADTPVKKRIDLDRRFFRPRDPDRRFFVMMNGFIGDRQQLALLKSMVAEADQRLIVATVVPAQQGAA